MFGILLIVTYILIGIFAGALLFSEERPIKRVWLGGVIGMMLLMWSHVPFSFLLGFNVASHILGLALTLCLAAALFFWKKHYVKKHPQIDENLLTDGGKRTLFGVWKFKPTANEIAMLICVLALTALSTVLVFSHTLQEINGGYWTGQCTYGDMNMHLGFVSSIAVQGTFPPTYSIMGGTEPLNYPFLCDSISSSLMIFGASLKLSYIVPMLFAFLFVYMGFWYLADAILNSTAKTCLSYWLFFLDGGFGIFYFLDNLGGDDKTNFTRIFTAFYNTPTNLVNESGTYTNIRWTNVIADMLLPQRATLFGWCCLFAVLYVLYTAAFKNNRRYFLIAGVLGGLLPMVHTHSYFALGLIAIGWIFATFIPSKDKKGTFFGWCLFGVPALALSIPQLLKWTFSAVGGGNSFVRFVFNWANSGSTDTWLWFWVKNVGLAFILLPLAFIHADKEKKLMYTGPAIIFLISEFIVFQPNTYDNIKLFFIWYVYTAIIVANLLVDMYGRLKGIRGRQYIAAVVVLVMTISGALTIAREVVSGTYDKENSTGYAYQLYSEKHVKAAEWITENTEPDATFLCYNNHNNSIASLTGRNIYVGAGTFLYFHGISYQDRERLMKSMLSDADVFEENKESAGIDYVFIGDYERANINGLISDYFAENYECVYSADGIFIYKVS